jgi:Ring finger domain
MSRGQCPNCGRDVGSGNNLKKCGDCGNLFCRSCQSRTLTSPKCPACGSTDVKSL